MGEPAAQTRKLGRLVGQNDGGACFQHTDLEPSQGWTSSC